MEHKIENKIKKLADRGAIFYVSHSGGKDSQAMMILIERLVPADQIVVVHADLEGIEWEDTQKQITDTIGDLPFHVVKNAKTFWDKVDHRGAFPSSGCRWCTSDLKRDPIHKLIRNDLKARDKLLAVNAIGIRAEESTSRSKQSPVTFNKRLSKAGREIWDIFPIFHWTTEEVFETIKAAGQAPHWAYGVGMDRLSCCFCIMATDRDLTIAAEHNPELYVKYVEKERELGFTLKNGKTLEEITGIKVPTQEADEKKEVFGVAYGLGIDSTAMLVGLKQRGIRPDFILFADVGSEKAATYAYLPIIQEWLKENDFPPVTVVKYQPVRAPYTTMEGNMAMNATLPGATFGRASCTIKWKIDPQNKWTARNEDCIEVWEQGGKVTKAIGFNADEGYRKSRASDKAHANDPHFDYVYPLQDWDWSREECKRQIAAEGLPVPPKSACIFCPNQKPEEVMDMTEEERGRVVRIEVNAEPYNRKVHGLWRRPRKADGRPGSITQYMIENEIPFILPEDLPDEMPLNPNCGKFKNGFTFRPPHDAPNLADMVSECENIQHWDTIEALGEALKEVDAHAH